MPVDECIGFKELAVTIVSNKVRKTCYYKFHKVFEWLNWLGVTTDITDGGLRWRYIPRKNLCYVV